MAKENENGEEKSEEPTEKRMTKARGEGNLPQSQEVNTAAILTLSFIMLSIYGYEIKDKMAYIMQLVIRNAFKITLDQGTVHTYFYSGVLSLIALLMPFLMAIAATGVIINILQHGWNFSTKALEPKFSKVLNVIEGVKNKFFNIQTVANLGKSILKIVLCGAVGYLTIIENLSRFNEITALTLAQIIGFTGSIVLTIAVRMLVMLVLIAIGDWIFTKWKYKSDMKMTKQEVKEERKNSEISPEIKKKMMQRRVDLFLKNMQKEVPKADVVITNPIHVAVALKYDSQKAVAPIIVAKGLRLVADRIKTIAKENNVAIVENPPLARSLYKNVEIGNVISEEYFKTVAEVLAYVYKLKEEQVA